MRCKLLQAPGRQSVQEEEEGEEEEEEEEEEPHLFNGFMDGFNDEEDDAAMNHEIDITDGIYHIVKDEAATAAAEAVTPATNVHENSEGLLFVGID